MTGVVLCRSDLVDVVCPDAGEFQAILTGDRTARPWAADYPTEGDTLMATLRGARTLEAAEPWGPLQIVERATGIVVGGIGFKGAPEAGAVEIGYGLAATGRGRGLATEAVLLLLGVAARHGLDTVLARTLPENLASQAVLRRAGFTPETVHDPDGHVTWSRAVGAGAAASRG